MSGQRVVIGVGNPFRRDDGVGWAVAGALEPEVGPVVGPEVGPVEGTLLDGEPARLLDVWAGADHAIVVDAVRSGATPGAVGVVAESAVRGSSLPHATSRNAASRMARKRFESASTPSA